MSAIGGIVTPNRNRVETGALMDMSRSMILRGKDQRGAYINGGVGLFHNRTILGESERMRQPFSVARNGKNYTVAVDGDVRGRGDFSGVCPGMGVDSAAELVLECYFAYGSDFADSLDGSYALVLCDEARDELILARDREGQRPLFYSLEGERLAFSSEIKGLLRCGTGAARVDIGRLRAHMTSPCGTYRGEDLYRDVYAIPPGHCGVYSKLGLTVFAQDTVLSYEERTSPKGVVVPSVVCPEEREMERILTETLFAFDYPQFDHLMPGVLLALKDEKAKKRRSITIEDGSLCMDIGYARERADRLGSLRGVRLQGIPPKENAPRERELKKMDRLLRVMLEKTDHRLVSRLFGEHFEEMIAREKNTAKRIRMQGMLWQSVVWAQNYSLMFV